MKTSTQYVIRAIPAPGHERRWRAGRPWGKAPTTVVVVDSPAPDRIETDRDGKVIRSFSGEISPANLAELRSDPHIAVSLLAGEGGATVDEVNTLKAELAASEEKLKKARLDLSAAHEDVDAQKRYAIRQAEELGGKVQSLTAERDALKGQLAQRSEKPEKAKNK